jgi:sialidase-1
MSYGHRRKPLGVQARLSNDNGETWGEPLVIAGDGDSGDLGYPASVETAAGLFVTVWYEKLKGADAARLRQARWRLAASSVPTSSEPESVKDE